MPYRIDPNTGQPVWDGTSIPQASRDSLGTQIRNLQDQIDTLSFIDLDDAPTTYTGQSGKIVSVKSTEDGLEFITNTGGGGVTDGDKGDITVAGSGATWTIDASAVTEAKIADGAVTANKIGTGAVGPTQLASTAVTAGSYTLANITVDADGRITAASNGTAGSGTVTTVSVVTANGVSGTVATATSTPEITLTLGAITPSSVNGVTLSGTSTPSLAVSGTTSVSGTNTGDQTITLTGDVTGSGTGSFAAALANSGVTAGSYIRATITVDEKGRVTSATSNTAGEINGSAGTVDNAITRADGTGGSAVQGSAIVIDDIDATTQQNVAIRNVDPATNSAIAITPKGTGAFILGPKPDGLSTGGDARGVRALDLQRSRSLPSHIASNTDSALIGGANNTASGQRSGVFCGESNTASATRSACFAGQQNVASAAEAVTTGGAGALANRIGMQAQSNGVFSSTGDAQRGTLILRRQTTDATQTELTLDGGTPTGTAITTSDRIILLNNQTIMADVYVVARSASGTNDAGYHRRCLITRDANAASTAITGLQPIGTDMETAGASSWDVTLAADTTNGSLQVLVTGAAATNINWVAEVNLREVIRA